MPNLLNVPITPPRVAFIDPRTGVVSREWYSFFLSLFQLTSGSSQSLGDLQKTPPAPVDAMAQIAELKKQIQSLEIQARSELGTLSQLQQDNVPWLRFDTTPSGTPTGTNAHGTLYWDDADGVKTLNLIMEDSGGVVQQIGEETYYRVKASAAITKGQVVMVTGTVGASGALKGAPDTGLTATQGEYVLGVASQDIANTGWGCVTWFGLVSGIDTTGGGEAWVDGEILYYNPSVTGGLTKTVPTAPNPRVVVATVVSAAASGSLFVRPAFGSTLGVTDSNVQISSLANNDILIYDGVDGRWENKAPTDARDALGLGTGAPSNGQMLIGNGTDFTTAALTAGSNISVTNDAGSVTIATSGSSATVTLAKITGGGTDGSLTFSDGAITGYTAPT